MSKALRGGVCVLALVLASGIGATRAQQGGRATEPSLNFYGRPGLVDMPTAESLPAGTVSIGSSYMGGTLRSVLNFQIAPRLSGSFRYSRIEDFFAPGDPIYDRSFDLRYRFVDEGPTRPAVAVGLQDFGGTGIFSGEYVVATKHLRPELAVSGGIGWGRFGSYNSFDNPLSVFGDSFDDRPQFDGDITNTGRFEPDRLFSGPAALFAGVSWAATDRLLFKAEYSSDDYETERRRTGFDRASPINVSASYRFDNGLDLTGAWLYGSELGVVLSYSFHPDDAPGARRDIETPAGPAVTPRAVAARQSWNRPGAVTGDGAGDGPGAPLPDAVPETLAGAATRVLGAEGIELLAFNRTPGGVALRIRNARYRSDAQAIGRAARALTAVLPPEIGTISIVPVRNGLPLSRVTLARADLEELEGSLDGAWKSYARARIEDAADATGPALPGAYPRLAYGLDLYLGPTFSDPDNFLAEGGVRLDAALEPLPGLVLSTDLRQPLLQRGEGAVATGNTTSSPDVPQVRSDAGLFEDDTDLELRELKAGYYFRPGKDLYGRVSAGYLEEMYGGVSGELLWKAVDSPLALGAEVNVLRKRDPGDMFGFGDYEATTGYVSAYYDFGNGFLGQVDAGRYLAGDWGATVALDREFSNGFRLGAYFTRTDMTSDEFGEGSFDKGIRFEIPVTWLTGRETRRSLATTWRPINGDGGARIRQSDRLYETLRDAHGAELQENWGSFWE